MAYFAGIDGGGTKTRCIIGDAVGNIVADCTKGPSNHQNFGSEKSQTAIREAFNEALVMANLARDRIKYVFLGLSGADIPSDFDLLYSICDPVFGAIPYQIVNDAWISMRCGLTDSWGAVSICGTGANAAARHPNGNRYILRSLCYELGNYGGGGHLTEKALHRAFRASEGTGPSTLLVEHLPPLFGASDMDDLLSKFYPYEQDISSGFTKVPPLIFELANRKDRVCQDLLIDMGHVMGEMVAGVIAKLGMDDMETPVVLGGSIYKGCNPLLIDELTTVLHCTAPRAYLVKPFFPPVVGAYLSALDEMGSDAGFNIYENIKRFYSLK